MMKRLLILLSVFAFFSCKSPQIYKAFADSQKMYYTQSWEKLDNYPLKRGRTDDLFFFNPDRGFVINSQGILLLTENGGESWEQKFSVPGSFFRCITFKDSLNGWVGTLGMGDEHLSSTDSFIMYGTKDGGETWTPTEIEGPYPEGLCGLQTVSDKVIVGCGMVRGPSYFIKSVDGGETWQSYDLNHLAGSLIAPHFFDESHGILLGGSTTDKIECRSLVLETFDGGVTWDTAYISKQKGEYCWKASFPTRTKGFISIQRNVDDGNFYCLQTNDGGKTWFENIYETEDYYVQGVGFLNENMGWLGGSVKWTMETRDGGQSWRRVKDIGRGFNKFQFFGDSIAYGTGFGVYKLENPKPMPFGKKRTFHESGKIKSEIEYADGQKNGSATYFHESGKIKSKGIYQKNVRHGKWQFFNKTGTLVKTENFQNGAVKIKKKELQKFAGSYQVRENAFRQITVENGQLYSKHSQSETKHLLVPVGKYEFVFNDLNDYFLKFKTNENGAIDRHLMSASGRESTAMKVVD